ncbi:hypothetical protein C5167_042749 [Papaver somniferum]|uniref:PGG domain-containing protein n=1 Tax=Papaver somniferum TaxID=3469 RepID=A0A4Y7L3P8_PAPSO|nr:uncharacterized protein LOC113317122 [Papaver somniferum]RZC80174.1 hypothetical protein C5167_042749 [Papaver somniferum]
MGGRGKTPGENYDVADLERCMVEELLKRCNDRGNTPLHEAAHNGSTEAADIIIQNLLVVKDETYSYRVDLTNYVAGFFKKDPRVKPSPNGYLDVKPYNRAENEAERLSRKIIQKEREQKRADDEKNVRWWWPRAAALGGAITVAGGNKDDGTAALLEQTTFKLYVGCAVVAFLSSSLALILMMVSTKLSSEEYLIVSTVDPVIGLLVVAFFSIMGMFINGLNSSSHR